MDSLNLNVQSGLRFGVAESGGRRPTMEDAFFASTNVVVTSNPEKTVAFFGVYDGHGGRVAADYCKDILHLNVLSHPNFTENPLEALREGIIQTDAQFLDNAKESNQADGSTAVCCCIIDNELYVANVGDAELCISRKGQAVALTEIHNPAKNPKELDRVAAAGGRIYNKRVGHPWLNPQYFNIAVSRAIGDFMYKSAEGTKNKVSGLITDPYLHHTTLDFHHDHFLILACDGVWDVLTHQDAVNFVAEEFEDTDDPQIVCERLVKEALNRDTTDNVTAIVITWKSFARNPDSPSSDVGDDDYEGEEGPEGSEEVEDKEEAESSRFEGNAYLG